MKHKDVTFRGRPIDALTEHELREALYQCLKDLKRLNAPYICETVSSFNSPPPALVLE